jgi:hypothetical protein
MASRPFSLSATLACTLCLVAASVFSHPQSSSSQQSSSTSGPPVQREKAPSIIDPAGPTISLISSEPVFVMASALNACGYDEGLEDSAPVRKKVRDEINGALAISEDARKKRDAICLYIAQHRLTGSEHDISQYISLALYLSPPPDLETTVELTEMPPDATQVAEMAPLLKDFSAAVDLHGIWLTLRRSYDEEINRIHDPLTQMIVANNFYLKMPASTYDGRRFVIVIEPMLSPRAVNARIYGPDYVVVTSAVDGKIRMNDVRHTYLHYMIEPLLYSRANAIDRSQPILKTIRDAPLEFRFRSDTVALTVECLIKAIEARTMDTGVPDFKMPAGVDRSEMPKYEGERHQVELKKEAVRQTTVRHDMTQGFVLTQYFYDALIQFEKDPASLRDNIGEMVYSMDVDQQTNRAKHIQFDTEADADVLSRPKPRKLEGLDLAEAKLQAGDSASAANLARPFLTDRNSDSLQAAADSARANFVLARVALINKNPEEAAGRFKTTIDASKDPRLLAWSHIYLGRMLDLSCKRDEAVSEYKEALETRDGEQDTRIAAERGVKTAYAPIKGHSCQDDADDDSDPKADPKAPATTKPQ